MFPTVHTKLKSSFAARSLQFRTYTKGKKKKKSLDGFTYKNFSDKNFYFFEGMQEYIERIIYYR